MIMTVTLFLELLFICSLVTGLLTEAGKQLLNNFPNNIIALAAGLAVGIAATAIVYQFNGINYTANNIICMFLMGLSSAAGAMLGYDKIVQCVKQIAKIK